MNRYEKHQAAGWDKPLHKRKAKVKRHAEFAELYRNSGCTFAYERIGKYNNFKNISIYETV